MLISISASFAQITKKNVVGAGNFKFSATPLNYSFFLSTDKQNKISAFYPLLHNNQVDAYFDELQSIIIPAGIIDTVNNIVYLENSANDIVCLNITNGKVIRHIRNVCCPIAVVDNNLIALSRTIREAKSSYNLFMLDSVNKWQYRAHWGRILLPDWLSLPADGERQKFVFSVHCYNSILSVVWQASNKTMFPNPISLIIPTMSEPTALQGSFSCDLKSQTIVNQEAQESDSGFLGYLTTPENNLPIEIVPDSSTVAMQIYGSYLFALNSVCPPEHNIAGAGILAKRELEVRDLHTGKILWSHVLPAAFIPLL